MNKNFSDLDNTFNVEDTCITVSSKPSIVGPSKGENDSADDYEYTRAQYYSILSKGQEALDSALQVAQSSDHPRAYEVVGQLLKHNADIADKLIDLQKKMKELNKEEINKGPTTITNNSLFVGSTAELQKLLKSQKPDN